MPDDIVAVVVSAPCKRFSRCNCNRVQGPFRSPSMGRSKSSPSPVERPSITHAQMLPAPSITDCPVPHWDEKELAAMRLEEPINQPYNKLSGSKYNPTPGTGRTGATAVPPNPFPFYSDEERYVPQIQADGGQLSEWSAMYAPTKEEAEVDREAAYKAGIPHGFKPAGVHVESADTLLNLLVVSDLHPSSDYGEQMDPKTGRHSGGPFTIQVSLNTRVEQLRTIIRDVGGIIPALQKLSYAGKHMDDSQRTLQHYGIGYWHARFPHWPIKIRRF